VEHAEKQLADAGTTVALWLAKVRSAALRRCETEAQMSVQDLLVLEAVAGGGKRLTIKDLENVLDRHISNCGRRVNALVKSGFLKKDHQKENGHSRILIRTTPKGTDLFLKLQTAFAWEIAGDRQRVDERTRKQLANALTALKGNFSGSATRQPHSMAEGESSRDPWAKTASS